MPDLATGKRKLRKLNVNTKAIPLQRVWQKLDINWSFHQSRQFRFAPNNPKLHVQIILDIYPLPHIGIQ
jgi:hypothetical protein